MIVRYPAVFHSNDDGTITVTFPDLPGCTSEGRSRSHALYMAKDALALWIGLTQVVNGSIPSASLGKDVDISIGEHVVMVEADTENYELKQRSKAVRRNVSLPAWMFERAGQEGLSLSRELQDALNSRFAEIEAERG